MACRARVPVPASTKPRASGLLSLSRQRSQGQARDQQPRRSFRQGYSVVSVVSTGPHETRPEQSRRGQEAKPAVVRSDSGLAECRGWGRDGYNYFFLRTSSSVATPERLARVHEQHPQRGVGFRNWWRRDRDTGGLRCERRRGGSPGREGRIAESNKRSRRGNVT
jgi:hypothetical protein